MKQTSIETYRAIIREGTYGKTLLKVLNCVAEHGPINQTMAHVEISKTDHGLQKYTISPRFAVLERMGLIGQSHVANCPLTNRKTVFWKLTGRTKPLKSFGEASKAVRVAKEKGSASHEAQAEKIKELERRVLRLEQIASSFSSGQMTMI